MDRKWWSIIGLCGIVALLCSGDEKKASSVARRNEMSGIRKRKKSLSDIALLEHLEKSYSAFLNSDNDKTYVLTGDKYVANQIGSNEKVTISIDRDGVLHKEYADGRKTKLNIGKDSIVETESGEFAIKDMGLTKAKIIAPKSMITTKDYLGQRFASEISNHTSEDIQILSSSNRALEARRELFKQAQRNAGPNLDNEDYKPVDYLSGHDKELLQAIGARFDLKIS
jgi:hypothetical protein